MLSIFVVVRSDLAVSVCAVVNRLVVADMRFAGRQASSSLGAYDGIKLPLSR